MNRQVAGLILKEVMVVCKRPRRGGELLGEQAHDLGGLLVGGHKLRSSVALHGVGLVPVSAYSSIANDTQGLAWTWTAVVELGRALEILATAVGDVHERIAYGLLPVDAVESVTVFCEPG